MTRSGGRVAGDGSGSSGGAGLAWLRGGGGRAGAMAEAGPQAPPPPGTPSRHEKSLGLLTTKFVSLLQEAKDGVLDLKLVRPGAWGTTGGRDGQHYV